VAHFLRPFSFEKFPMAKKRARSPAGAPSHLSAEAATYWEKLRLEWHIEDEAGLLILQTSMEAFDRMRAAQAKILEDGITVLDRFGQQKPNPACVIERDSRAAFANLIRQLGIEPDEE